MARNAGLVVISKEQEAVMNSPLTKLQGSGDVQGGCLMFGFEAWVQGCGCRV